MGTYALGGGYTFENPKHAVEFLIGVYDGGEEEYFQTNILYRYSRWEIDRVDRKWYPLQMGVFTVRTWDQDNYFLKSPSQYPADNYYESTAFRWGFELGATVLFIPSQISLSYRLRVIDNGIVALYNNGNKDLQYFTSSGLALQYHF